MVEKRVFLEELKNTSKSCTPEYLRENISNPSLPYVTAREDINDIEKNFHNHLMDLHSDPTYVDSAKLTMMGVQVLNLPTEEKNKMNLLFFRAELVVHDGDRAEAENCIRRHLEWKTVGQIAETVEPGFTSKMVPVKIERLYNRFKRNIIGGWIVYVLSKFFAVLGLYMDLIRDCLLFMNLVQLISLGSWLDLHFFNEFSHQLLWLLFFSILVPLIFTAFNIARDPGILLGFDVRTPPVFTPWLFFPICLVISPALPCFLTNVRDIEKEKTRELLIQSRGLPQELEDVHQRIVFTKKVDRKILDFKEVELVVEVTLQTTVHLIMILSNVTATGTELGLNNAFEDRRQADKLYDDTAEKIKNNTMAILIWSLLWTLKTSLTTYIKLHKDMQRGFLPTKAKLILALRGFIANICSIGSFIIFFSTVLGLFNLMGHYKMEEKLFAKPHEMNESIPIRSLRENTNELLDHKFWLHHYLPSLTNGSLEYTFDVVYRFLTIGNLSYGKDNLESKDCKVCPSASDYTLIPLGWTYAIFLAIITAHYCVVFTSKNYTSKMFKKAKLSKRLWHSLKCVTISDAFTGWDRDLDDTFEEMKEKFEETKWEITVGSLINCCFNGFKIWPLPIASMSLQS